MGVDVYVDPTEQLRTVYKGWTRFEMLWLLIFLATALYVYVGMDGKLIGLVATVTGMITVVLVAKGRISNYYFGVINTVLYAYIALQSQFYGEVMLNLGYYLPIQFVGLYLWTANPLQDAVDTVEVRSLSWKHRGIVVVGTVVAIGGYALFLKFLGGNLPWFDATSTVLSVIAMVLLVIRTSEQWFLWMAVNIVSIYMWTTRFITESVGIAMVVMWSAYLVNSCYGYYNWRRMEQSETAPEVVPEA